MSKDTGGPAFPQDLGGRRGDDPSLQGMTLRDYFAAQAAAGLGAYFAAGGVFVHPESWAGRAYEIADAMLAERNK